MSSMPDFSNQNPFADSAPASGGNPFADENPYASPQVAQPMLKPGTNDGLWQFGKQLVMHKQAPLPDRCVKSNVPTQRRLKRQLYWHHPAIYLSILVSILVYVILALVLRKSATIHIGLSDEWFAKRRRAMLIGWTLVLLSIGMLFVGGAMVDHNALFGVLFGLGPIVFVIGAVYGLLAARMVAAVKITDNFVYLKGVCPEFLADLPPWPQYE